METGRQALSALSPRKGCYNGTAFDGHKPDIAAVRSVKCG